MHKLLIFFEVVFWVALGLVVMSVVFATVRAVQDRKSPPFKYPDDVPRAMAEAAAEGYWHRLAVALDIFFNVFVFRGEQDETISTHAWRSAQAGKLWGKLMNFWLNGIQEGHGARAASGDLQRSAVRVEKLKKALGIA